MRTQMRTQMRAPLTQGVRHFLDDTIRCAVVASLNGDGTILQAVVYYAVRDDGVLINSRVGRRWPTNLQHDQRCSVAIAEGQDYAIIRGLAHVVATGNPALEDMKALARRYNDDPEQFNGQERISFLVWPEHIATHGQVT